MIRLISKGLPLAILAIAFSFLVSKSAQTVAAQPAACISAAITSNTTWTLAGSPYNVCAGGIDINAGATLTIEPGVTVSVGPGAGSKLYVTGSLVANGTSAQPITFTGATASAGSWAGFAVSGSVAAPAALTLDNAVIDYGGISGSAVGGVVADVATLNINHTLVENGAGNGVYLTSNTTFTVQNTTFTDNGQYAIEVAGANKNMLLTGLTATGNGTNAIYVVGNTPIPGQRRWADPGIPYLVDAALGNSAGDTLTIDPGNTLIFTAGGVLGVGGRLDAVGTDTAPIVMTAQNPLAPWRGIQVYGGSAHLEYVTIEYAGNDIHGANIEVGNGSLVVTHSIIRNSSKDGVKFDTQASGSIQESQIYGNALDGVNVSDPSHPINTSNNWWGDPSGPQSLVAGCNNGLGDKVTAGALFKPFQTSSSATVPIPLSSAPNLTLTPRAWFAPDDGVTKIYFDATLRDGNGVPIPAQTVVITSSIGSVSPGGVTDATGHTLLYLTSTVTGDATVTASLSGLATCEVVLSPTSTVTFTPAPSVPDLFPNSPAPYFNGDIVVSPQPVVTGITTFATAKLTNPLPTAITVNVEFGFVQSGIGLVFGPFADFTNKVIQPGASLSLTGSFVPVVSGHYCVQVSYTIVSIAPAIANTPLPQLQNFEDLNINVNQASTGNKPKEDGLKKTRNSLKAINLASKAYNPNPAAVPLVVANAGIEWDLNNAEKISNALQGDPPRQDYTVIDMPVVLKLPPISAGNGVSAARAAALNQLDSDLAQANAYGTAATTALDRYGGASAAGELQWASVQSNSLLEFNKEMGASLIAAAADINTVISAAATDGITSVMISESDVIAMQADLTANGFSAQEIADAHAVGLTDADLADIRASLIAADPQDLAGDYIPKMQDLASQFVILGNALENPYVFAPGFSVSGSAGIAITPNATGNSMAQVYTTSDTITLGNTLATPRTIDIRVRRIDLPADWTADTSLSQVTLAAGATTTLTVTITPGSPVPQGSLPQVAVEGYDHTTGQLIGGVLEEVMVPDYFAFDGKIHQFFPVIAKQP